MKTKPQVWEAAKKLIFLLNRELQRLESHHLHLSPLRMLPRSHNSLQGDLSPTRRASTQPGPAAALPQLPVKGQPLAFGVPVPALPSKPATVRTDVTWLEQRVQGRRFPPAPGQPGEGIQSGERLAKSTKLPLKRTASTTQPFAFLKSSAATPTREEGILSPRQDDEFTAGNEKSDPGGRTR